MKVRKRDGRLVELDENKIKESIKKAAQAVEKKDEGFKEREAKVERNIRIFRDLGYSEEYSEELAGAKSKGVIEDGRYTEYNRQDAKEVTDFVIKEIKKKQGTVSVDKIQDLTEKALIKRGHAKTAKEYILYRAKRSHIRQMNSTLMSTFKEITFSDASDVDAMRENANVDGDSAMGTMLKYGTEGAKMFNLAELVSNDIANEHRSGDIHIHDLDFKALTMTCSQIDLDKLFKGGFNTGHGFIREPAEIRSYAALACIAIQANQNDMHRTINA